MFWTLLWLHQYLNEKGCLNVRQRYTNSMIYPRGNLRVPEQRVNHMHNWNLLQDIIFSPSQFVFGAIPNYWCNIKTTLITCYKSVNVTVNPGFHLESKQVSETIRLTFIWCLFSWSYLWISWLCTVASGEWKCVRVGGTIKGPLEAWTSVVYKSKSPLLLHTIYNSFAPSAA